MKLTNFQINRYVDERYFERGRGYCDQGLVVLKRVTEKHAEAYCVGGRVYKIALSLNRGKLEGDCTCPAFVDFGPCKHIAATALAVIADKNPGYNADTAAIERVDQHHSIRKRLLDLSKSELSDFLLQLSDEESIAWLLDEEL